MFWLLDKAILRGMAAFWLQLPSDSPDEYQMSQSPLDCFSLWVYCSAVQQRTDMTLPCTLPGENPTWCIRLTENLIIMNSFLCNRIHVMILSATCLCERLLFVCQWEVKHAGVFACTGANSTYWFASRTGANANSGSISSMSSQKVSVVLFEAGKQNSNVSGLKKAKNLSRALRQLLRLTDR